MFFVRNIVSASNIRKSLTTRKSFKIIGTYHVDIVIKLPIVFKNYNGRNDASGAGNEVISRQQHTMLLCSDAAQLENPEQYKCHPQIVTTTVLHVAHEYVYKTS